MWVLDILSGIGKMSPIQIAILMEFALSGDDQKKITEILNILTSEYEGLWIPKKGTIYPAVHNLHVRGYLKMSNKQPYGYTITTKGLESINEIMENLEIQLKAYLKFMGNMLEHYSQINQKESAILAENQQTVLKEQINFLKKIKK